MTKNDFSCKLTCARGVLTIRGHVFRSAPGVLPAVILSHGFLANEKTVWTYAKLLADMGYAAFTFDYCGGGVFCHSDGRSRDMTVFTEVEDLNCVMDYVRSRDDVDPDNITLLGCSQGGFVSAMTAKQRPEQVAKLVLFYPALCIPDDARAGHMMFAKFDPADPPRVLCRFPMALGDRYARSVMDLDVYDLIGGYTGPTLLVHGTKDNIVDLTYSERASTLYPDCVFHVIAGGTHGFKGKKDKEAQAYLAGFMQL